jgi:hypothetical protein
VQRRWLGAVALVVAVLASTLASTAGPAQAQTGYFTNAHVYGASSFLCWDLGSYADGTPLVIAPCHGDATYFSQQWTMVQPGLGDGFYIRSTGSGNKCLDVGSYEKGAIVGLFSCNYNMSYWSQRWTYQLINGRMRFMNWGAGLCMDLGSNAAGTRVGLYECHSETWYTSQQWTYYNT